MHSDGKVSNVNLQELMAEDRDKVCPEVKTSIFTRLTFGWISPLMVKGFKYAIPRTPLSNLLASASRLGHALQCLSCLDRCLTCKGDLPARRKLLQPERLLHAHLRYSIDKIALHKPPSSFKWWSDVIKSPSTGPPNIWGCDYSFAPSRLVCRKPLQMEDIWELPPGDKVGRVSERFEKIWDDELSKPKGPSLVNSASHELTNI